MYSKEQVSNDVACKAEQQGHDNAFSVCLGSVLW